MTVTAQTAHTRGNTYTASYRHLHNNSRQEHLYKHKYTDIMQLQPIRPTQPTHGNIYTTPYRHYTTTAVTNTYTNANVQTMQLQPIRPTQPTHGNTYTTPYRHYTTTAVTNTYTNVNVTNPLQLQLYKRNADKTLATNTARTRRKHTHGTV